MDAGAASEVPSEGGLRAAVDGASVAIFRTREGFRAVDDRCPHAGASLSEGTCREDVIVCPWHGFRFDARSGACLVGEGLPGILSRNVEVRDGRLLVRR